MDLEGFEQGGQRQLVSNQPGGLLLSPRVPFDRNV